VSYAPVALALFAPPPDYRVNDMRSMMKDVDFGKFAEMLAPGFERMYCGPGATPRAK
jgi:hypothetical protein